MMKNQQLFMAAIAALVSVVLLVTLAPTMSTTAMTKADGSSNSSAALNSNFSCGPQRGQHDVNVKIVPGEPASATFTNTSLICSYDIGLASYTFNGQFTHQTLFDSTMVTITPAHQLTLQVRTPCTGQLDAFLGTPSNDGVTWGRRLLAGQLFQRPCPTPTATDTPTSTATSTATVTNTLTTTSTATVTNTPTPTDTSTPTASPTPTDTSTPTASPTPTDTSTPTASPTSTTTPTATTGGG